ncbi:hypothetical protein Q1695_001570 [Nippostrongylus brasiliensis]|nr:hypothetical protein Q1695_001570 [Nippostrongylus brasiliensis]
MSSTALLTLTFLLSCYGSTSAKCFYNHQDGYALHWLVFGEHVIFRLEHSNFSRNFYTGIGFGSHSHNFINDRIVILVNSSGADVFNIHSHERHFSSHHRQQLLEDVSVNFRNGELVAEFSRPLVSGATDLRKCHIWNFITTPTEIKDVKDGKYAINAHNSHQKKICHIDVECDALNLLEATDSQSDFISSVRATLSDQVDRTRRWKRSLNMVNERRTRGKRQTTGYVPTNNIYGYDYSSQSGSTDAARLVMNPNYAYLNDALSQGYAKNYVQAETAYSQNLQNNGLLAYDAGSSQSIATTNEQQNAINYQQILQGTGVNTYGSSSAAAYQYNPPTLYSSTPSPIASYQYSSTPLYSSVSMSSGSVQYDSPTTIRQQASSAAPYQSVVDLKTTRLRDPTVSTFNSAVSSGTSSSMYYPYRTQTSQGTVVVNNGVSTTSNGVLRDASTNSCQLSDPYWCNDYVRTYMNSSITLSGYDRQTVCLSLRNSLQDSYNGCCQAMQAAGCM